MARRLLPFSYAWRNVMARKASTAVTLAGVSVSVMVFVVISATGTSVGKMAASTGSPHNMVVLSEGARSIESSSLSPELVRVIQHGKGVARNAAGESLASPELVVTKALRGAAGKVEFIDVRGVTPIAFEVHPGMRILEGSFPSEPGEILLGRLAGQRLGDPGVGSRIDYEGRSHLVAGIFDAKGQIFEGEIWTRLTDLQAEERRTEAGGVVVRLSDPLAVPFAVDLLDDSKRIAVRALTELKYYERTQRASGVFVTLGGLIGVIMGLGAVMAGMNTMYAAMSRRIREMGTLRALGFGSWQVGGSLLLESVVIGTLGGLIGVGLARLFDGYAISFFSSSFELGIDGGVAAQGFALAIAIGFFGGLLPARAAARLEIVEALRHL